MRVIIPCILSLASVSLLTSCQRYEVSVNDRLIYQPPSLYTNVIVDDDSLEQCLYDIIKQQRLTKAEQLEKLHCPAGSILSLQGIATFSKIRQLVIKDHRLTNINDIAHLTALTHADLRNNALHDATALTKLAALKELDLRGNDALDCSSTTALRDKADLTLHLPLHCAKQSD